MKKISKNSLKGLTELSEYFPTYSESAMKYVVGGYSISEMESILRDALGNTGYGFSDGSGNYFWFRSYDAFADSYQAYQTNNNQTNNIWGYSNFSYYGDGNKYSPWGDCAIHAIAYVAGVSYQSVRSAYAQMLSSRLHISYDTAYALAAVYTTENDIKALFQQFTGGCNTTSINTSSGASSVFGVGLIKPQWYSGSMGHVVVINYFDGSNYHYWDPQNNMNGICSTNDVVSILTK